MPSSVNVRRRASITEILAKPAAEGNGKDPNRNDQLGRADRNDWAIGIGFLGIVLVVYGLNRYFKRQRV